MLKVELELTFTKESNLQLQNSLAILKEKLNNMLKYEM